MQAGPPRYRSRWTPRSRIGALILRAGVVLLATVALGATLVAIGGLSYLHFDRRHLPDLGPFTRFEFPTIGHIYDTNGLPLVELAAEHRQITQYADIPPIVRDAILAAEDKHFFSHNGVDYVSLPRVAGKIRWFGPTMFPQGGSTITQQLVRGLFLQGETSREGSGQLQPLGRLPRVLAWMIGTRNANMAFRKCEEIRLSLWLEEQMRATFGSKRRAKEEILARYVSFVYMGHGQYGFAQAAEYYLGRPLSSLTAEDADKAALLAGIMKAPRDYAPTAKDPAPVLRRRNQILALMAAGGTISREQMTGAVARPLSDVPEARLSLPSSAVVEHVLDELRTLDGSLGMDDLMQGRIQVDSTIDARAQRIVTEALEHGLAQYESRHPAARGVIQGSIVALRNGDGSILAETGGRQVYRGRATAYTDYNRVRRSLRQPGSTMKPIVYLAAFRYGPFSLETLVPDEPISVPDGRTAGQKWISNYDGVFKGLIPIREALAESRNAAAIWIATQVGIDRVLQTARSLGVRTPLQRYVTTALGASEVSLLELATAYRTIASGVLAQPYVIRQVRRDSGDVVGPIAPRRPPTPVNDRAIAVIQEGLRGVVRMPTGTAHTLDSHGFPIAVMGKTGTTNDFKDALFVGSTYGKDGITVAVRIGFDDSHSLGSRETGGRVALPVFQEVMLRLYQDEVAGPAPRFPPPMEQRITAYLQREAQAEIGGGRRVPTIR